MKYLALALAGLVMVIVSIALMMFLSMEHVAMAKCQEKHSYETCFQMFNR